MSGTSGQLQGLNGIRALAVMAVVWHHAHPGWPWLPASHNGFLGVDAFFVLSGYLITTLMLREQRSTGRISLKNFYIRRSLRIFPLYYALLALLTVYFVLSRDSSQKAAFLSELPYHLTYTSNWVELKSLMAITWSLSTEEQFYLIWPPVLVLLGLWSLVPLLAFLALNVAINFGFLDAWLLAIGIPYPDHNILQSTFTPILLGVLLAFALDVDAIRHRVSACIAPAVLWLLALVLCMALNIPGDVRGWPRLAIHLLTTAVLAGIVLSPQHGLTRLLEWRPLAYLGVISYGIYLLHKPALDVARRLLTRFDVHQPEVLFVLGMALSVLLAGLSFRFFEAPLLALKDRFR
jgi:peptidoglycan/LPS O-acetylase OafA/YrhL